MTAGRFLAGLAVIACVACVPADATRQQDVLIFAAASLKTALDEIEPLCRAATGVGFRSSFAASSALARQIEAGAPADLFVSADLDWMDYVEERGLIEPGTRLDLVGNRLVLVAPDGRAPALTIAPGFPLADALGDGRLAMADPRVVPAGRYAKAALTTLGVWARASDRLAPAENVRAALLLVSRGEAPLGIVYRSDAAADSRVVVVGTFPDDSHPPVVYPAALTRHAGRSARRVLSCLTGVAAQSTFERWGFDRRTTR